MALRIGWLADKAFALAAGGFNPRFTPPRPSPSSTGWPSPWRQRRTCGSAWSPTSRSPPTRCSSAPGWTSYAGYETFVGKFSAAAWASIDAMVQFDPFGFVADLDIGFMVAHNDNPFIGARLKASLSGPNPWHVEVSSPSTSSGTGRSRSGTTPARPSNRCRPRSTWRPSWSGAAEAADAWSAELPDAAGLLVTLGQARRAWPLVHPLGALTLRQRVLPLELEISRFGQAVPRPGTATTFTVTETALTVDGQRLAATARADLTPTTDDFAPGQFLDLTDDEKPGRPSSRCRPAYGWARPTPAGPGVGGRPVTAGVSVEFDYEVQVIDAVPSRGWQTRDTKPVTARLEDWLVDGLVVGGAAANSARVTELGRYAGPTSASGCCPSATWSAGGTPSRRPGADQLCPSRRRAGPAQQVVTLAEVVTVSAFGFLRWHRQDRRRRSVSPLRGRGSAARGLHQRGDLHRSARPADHGDPRRNAVRPG